MMARYTAPPPLKIGRELYDAGATRPVIVAALAEGTRPSTGANTRGAMTPTPATTRKSWTSWRATAGTRGRGALGGRGRGELSKIVVNNRRLPEVTAEAIEALAAHNDPPEIFVRAGRIVRVREDEDRIPEIQAMEDSHIKGRLARVANFVRTTERGETKVIPPDWLVKDVGQLPWWPFPALRGCRRGR